MTDVMDVKFSQEEIKKIEEIIMEETYPNGYKITEEQIDALVSFIDTMEKGEEGKEEGLIEMIRLMSALQDTPEQILEDEDKEVSLSLSSLQLDKLLRHPAAKVLIASCKKDVVTVVKGKKEILDIIIDIYEKI